MADRIQMPFGVVGRTGPGMRQGLEIVPREGVLVGANLGRAIVATGDFTAYVCNSAAMRPSSQITLRKLVTWWSGFGGIQAWFQRPTGFV